MRAGVAFTVGGAPPPERRNASIISDQTLGGKPKGWGAAWGAGAGAGAWLIITWTMPATTMPAMIGSICFRAGVATPLTAAACWRMAWLSWVEPKSCRTSISICGD